MSATDRAVYLDTETTGLGGRDEIVQIAVVDDDGTVLIDQLVKPHQPISPEVTAIHGITDEMVADAPTFDQVWDRVLALTAGRQVVIYNADFDVRLIGQSIVECGVPARGWLEARCAMRWYAAWAGRRWQSLGAALDQCGIPRPALHRAAADAEAVRLLVHYMNEQEALK